MEIALAPNPLEKLAVVIPAWHPGPELCPLVDALRARGFATIIVVDDGSGEGSRALFDSLETSGKVQLLRHAVNLGKGRALKTAINHYLNHCPGYEGLLTADADGQHTPDDIARVGLAFLADKQRVALGSRTFSRDVPLRSRFGNELTRRIFGFVTGRKLLDTQTGLRVLPTSLLPELLPLEGERYEYEMSALARICREPRPPLEVPIQTVYLDGNRSSHFDPIRDSMRIYFVLLRFYFSSIIAAGIDFLGFTIAFWASGSVLFSVVAGRLSSLVNFALNKRYVFNSGISVPRALVRYYALVAFIGTLSYYALKLFTLQFHWNVFAAKLFIDSALSFASFAFQRSFVFNERALPLAEKPPRA